MQRTLLSILLLLGLTACAAPPPPAPPPPPVVEVKPPEPTVWRAGIWLERNPAPGVVADLAGRGFTDLYLRTGPYRKDGTVSLPEGVAALRADAERFGVRLWAWLPGWWPQLDLQDPALVDSLAAAAAELAGLGFHGIQIDVEPTPDGDPGYLALLAALRKSLPEGVLLGAATHLVGPHPPQAEWQPDYLGQVAQRVDQVAVMAYDTYAVSAEAFRQIVTYQTVTALQQAPATTEVLIGVPTYEDRTERHTPETEPTWAGLEGVAEGFRQVDLAGRTTGWALYAHFTMNEAEWTAWQNRPR